MVAQPIDLVIFFLTGVLIIGLSIGALVHWRNAGKRMLAKKAKIDEYEARQTAQYAQVRLLARMNASNARLEMSKKRKLNRVRAKIRMMGRIAKMRGHRDVRGKKLDPTKFVADTVALQLPTSRWRADLLMEKQVAKTAGKSSFLFMNKDRERIIKKQRWMERVKGTPEENDSFSSGAETDDSINTKQARRAKPTMANPFVSSTLLNKVRTTSQSPKNRL